MSTPNIDEYPWFVSSLFVNKANGGEGLVHASIGISGEAGEILDAVKKHWVYGKPLDVENLEEELGDLLFYTFALMNILGFTLDSVLAANYAKLLKRYPNGYTNENAILRLDKDQK